VEIKTILKRFSGDPKIENYDCDSRGRWESFGI
jgi:hypothetical protein